MALLPRCIEPCLHHRESCLGPLAFLTAPHGVQISLSENGRRAERDRDTFQNGLVFSSRSIRVLEKVHLRIERCDQHWNGALRVGFTSTTPSLAPGFPPATAIPNLTNTPGYWAAAIPAFHAQPGAELHFWVTRSGKLMYKAYDGKMYQLLQKVNVQKPLWAMIDIYGQTRAVLLLAVSTFTFPCGHCCLCFHCAGRVVTEFGKCPLCRQPIVYT
ncbi:E3 ubiquitin-protein ligase NEURL3-like [Aplochiton taeniatus]